jgi:3-oxoadipate enol-lactonase
MSTGGSITRLGCPLHYWVAGPDDGPTVVLCHGATLDHHSFDAQVEPLAEAGYRGVTWDLRGHGRSTPMGGAMDVDTLADDLLAVMDHLGAPTAAMVGHSFGGFVVQQFTFRHPERVTAIALLGCTDLARRPTVTDRLLLWLTPRLFSRMSLDAFRRRTLQDLAASDRVKAYAERAMAGIDRDDFIAITMAGVRCLWEDSGFGTGYTIPKPFLLLHGAQDRANRGVYPRRAPRWAAREPRCQ